MDLVRKKEQISQVLSEPDVDLWKLRELCLTEGGLVDDTLRKRAWPKLVGLHGGEATERLDSSSSSAQRVGRSRIPRPPDPPGASHIFRQLDDSGEPSVPRENNERIVEGMDAPESFPALSNKKDRIAECRDADQIDRDVARCTWHLLTGSQRSRRLQMQNKHRKKVANLLKKKQRRLGNFINLTLLQCNANVDEEEQLRYYQGFHDVACVFLSALGGGGSGPTPASSSSPLQVLAASMGLDLPTRVLGQVAKSHFRDAMRSTFMHLQAALRLVLFPLLAKFDPEVHAHLYYCDMEPFFALSWVITWFSHDIRDTAVVKRLFDAFIVSHPLLPIYLSIAMILHPVNRMEILSTDCDFASVHQTLAGLPKNSSMVGWKFKVAEGYVSGDGTDEGSTASTDMDSTFLSEDLLDLDDAVSETQSMISSNLSVVGSNQARVPFQELIDTALSYMRRVPPRKLLMLARRYFVDDPNQSFLLDQARSISLLQSPPSWGLAATTPADWVIKQRLRESKGMKRTSRRDRRRSRSGTRSTRQISTTDEDIEKYLEEKKKTIAVIACGFGPGDDDDERRRKRRRMLMFGAVAAVLVAISYAAVVGRSRPSSGPTLEAGSLDHEPLETKGSVEECSVKTTSFVDTIAVGNSQQRDSATQRTPQSKTKVAGGRDGTKESTVSQAKAGKPAKPADVTSLWNLSQKVDTSPPRATSGVTLSTRRIGQEYILAPMRLMKDILLKTHHLKEEVDKAVHDLRRAYEERDPNLVPGSRMVYSFVSNARRVLLGKDGQGLAQDTVKSTRHAGVGKALKNARRFIANNARTALGENDAEVVAL